MKQFIIVAALTIAASSSWCGIDVDRAEKEGLPPRYCFDRQAAGNQTFGGFLKTACSGSECQTANTTLNL